MENLDANLIAVQWGLLSVFGVVMGLLITPAERYLQQFLVTGNDNDRKRAARWAASVRMTSLLVLLSLLGLSFLGARDAGLNLPAGLSTATWLLMTPLLAQAGFVILVFFLVRRVPPVLLLRLQQPPLYDPSPSGHRESTVIRFINETSGTIQVHWLDFEGRKDSRGPHIGGGEEGSSRTYEGHRFIITTNDGNDIGTVTAAAAPSKIVITPVHIQYISKGTNMAQQNDS